MTGSRQDEQGFTLIELLIVIMVMGALAAIVVFAIGSTRGDALKSACATRIRAIDESAAAVKVKTDSYPVGVIDGASPSNPLAAPQPGALLKDWPASSDFVLKYEGTAGTSYVVDVYKSDGTTLVAGCGAL